MEKRSKVQKVYYSIGEVADLLGVNSSLIRYWEDQFDQLKPRRSAGGTRHFTREDIVTLRAIQSMLKTQGLTIKGAREKLRQRTHSERAKSRTIMLLEDLKMMLLQVRDSIDDKGQ